MLRRLIGAAAVLVVSAGAFGLYIAERGGAFRTVEPHFAGRCVAVGGVAGAEDIVIDDAERKAWISSEDRRAALDGNASRGKLYLLDLASAAAMPVDATPPMPIDFHPHGISLHVEPDGHRTLFVINHQSFGGHRIEVFDIADNALAYQGGVVLADLKSPNAIVATGPRQFYVANDHGSLTPLGRWLERTFGLPRANVVYFDGERARIVADGLKFPSGMDISADGATLWVGELTGRAVRTYSREPIGGSLTLVATMPLDTMPDNLRRDASGNLWVAGHPKAIALARHFADASSPSPSQVIKLVPGAEGFTAEEVFADSGETLSAASVAAISGRRMLIGTILDPHFLDCTLP